MIYIYGSIIFGRRFANSASYVCSVPCVCTPFNQIT